MVNARARPRLVFVSPQFLFPMDAGGKIRSANLLMNLKGGAFRTRLVMPADAAERERWRAEIDALADETAFWRPAAQGVLRGARRIGAFVSPHPVSAAADAGPAARRAIAAALADGPDLVVIDYVQTRPLAPAALAPRRLPRSRRHEVELLRRRQVRVRRHRRHIDHGYDRRKRGRGCAIAGC